MSTPAAPASGQSSPVLAAGAAESGPGRRWRIGGFLLAGAAQLITISALVGIDHPAVTWAALLLAVAPAPLAAVTAFAPARLARPAAAVTLVVIVAGIAGAFRPVGLLFLPATAVLAVAAYLLMTGHAARPAAAPRESAPAEPNEPGQAGHGVRLPSIWSKSP